MSEVLLKSALLLVLAYGLGRGIGYLLTRRKTEDVPETRKVVAPLLEEVGPDEPAAAVLEVVAAAPVVGTVVKPVAAAPAKVKAKPGTRAKPEPAFKVSPLAGMSVDEVEAAIEAAGAPAEPARLKVADGGKPDALLDIVGIGPVNEVQLHALGIYHFRQIAAWSPENVKWVAERIKFPTRIVRENWMKQAAAYAAGKKG